MGHVVPLVRVQCARRTHRRGGLRWLPVNGLSGCQHHHYRYTRNDAAWQLILREAWGEPVYWELLRLSQKGDPKPDLEKIIASLEAELGRA